MAGPYTLTDGSGKSLYGSFSANSDLDAITIGQAACSILGLPYLLLTTSTPNSAFGVPPDPTTGGPTPPGYFQRWITFQFAARPLAVSAWQQLVNQLRALNPLTAGQLSELNPIISALQAAGATFDTTAVTGGLERLPLRVANPGLGRKHRRTCAGRKWTGPRGRLRASSLPHPALRLP